MPGGRYLGKVKLTPSGQAKLDTLIKARGYGGAARQLGVGLYIVEQLAYGGAMRPHVVERVERLLEERAA